MVVSPLAFFRFAIGSAIALTAAGCVNLSEVKQQKINLDGVDGTSEPELTIHPKVELSEHSDLQSLIDETLTVLASEEFRQNAASLEQAYPKLFFRKNWQDWSILDTANFIQSPSEGTFFRPTNLYYSSKAKTPYVSPKAKPDRKWGMVLNGASLRRWRSTNVVERSCAVNTLAHETMHTILDGNRLFVSVDGGRWAKPSRKNGTTASYVVGQLAQCTWLQREGRISQDEVGACMPVFYFQKKPSKLGVFAALRCNSFPEGRPVQL